MERLILSLAIILGLGIQGNAQYSTRKVSKKKQQYTDSIKQVEYDYMLPFLGQKVYRAGFDIPYPIGVMGNYLWMRQGLIIKNMQLGVLSDNVDVPLTAVDEFVKFGDNSNISTGGNLRADIWVLPFLNVYGIFGAGSSETRINLVSPVEFSTVVNQDVRTNGFGFMTAFGIGPLWMSVDANWTWSKPELLDRSVRVGVLGLRLGKTFTFNNRPDRNFTIWMGGFRMAMDSETVGQIALIDALPAEVWERRDEIVNEYNEWYDGLLPVIQARVDASPIPDIVERIEKADGESIIRYGMDKQVKHKWNGIIGAQYQMNKRWMIRTEWGVIGDRKSGLASLNYRFLW